MTIRPSGSDVTTEGRRPRRRAGLHRIKTVLIDPYGTTIASGSHAWENQFVDRMWTYSLHDVWSGCRTASRRCVPMHRNGTGHAPPRWPRSGCPR